MKRYRLFITLLLAIVTMQVTLAGDKIIVCGQNVQNFFYSLDRERTAVDDPSTPDIDESSNGRISLSNYNTIEGRTAKLNAIIKALAPIGADIYTFNEVECCDEIMELLAQQMSQSTGKTFQVVYDHLTYDKSTELNGIIKSGYIYNLNTVEPIGNSLPTGSGFFYQRQMRMQTFRQKSSGESFTLCMNHFKAGANDAVDANGVSNAQKREANAESLLQSIKLASDPDILIMGDLNCLPTDECQRMIQDAGYAEQLMRYGTTNLWTYGNSTYYAGSFLDHVYANSTMAEQVTGAEIKHIACPRALGNYYNAYSDHDPYVVTLELKEMETPTYAFTQASTVSAGEYLIAAKGNGNVRKVCTPVVVTDSRNYDTPEALDAEEVDGVITMSNGTCIMTFEDAGNGLFYIKDSNGRYASHNVKSGTQYYTTITATPNKSEAHKFKLTRQSNGAYEIKSTTSNYWLLYFDEDDSYNPNKFALYWKMFNGKYPFLYKRDTTPNSIDITINEHRANAIRKVFENGRLIIIKPDGHRYSIDGRLLQ